MAPPADELRASSGIWRMLVEPSPGRFAFAFRLALICTLTTLVAEIYATPEIALTVYIVFFLNKPDQVSSMAVTVALTVFATLILAFLFLIASPILSSSPHRIAAMTGISFGLLFLVSASKLEPIGSDVALVVAYALDVVGSAPFGELINRALLYAWLLVGIPAGVSVVVNLVLAPSPLKIFLREMAARLQAAADVVRGDADAISRLREINLQGDSELQNDLKLTALEHTCQKKDLEVLQGASDCVVTVLSAVQLMVNERNASPSPPMRKTIAGRLTELARVFEQEAYPGSVEPTTSDDAEEESTLASSSRALLNRGLADFGKPRPSSLNPVLTNSKFLASDAFSNPQHVYFAAKVTVAAMLCYLIYQVLNWPGIHTAFITVYIVSLGTAAETIQKLTLRLVGCLAGVVLGLFVMIVVIPRATGIGYLLAIVFVGVLIGAWVAVGSPRVSYAGFQLVFAYLLCVVQGPSPSFDMSVARDRVIGILIGNFMSYLVATRLWPESVMPRVDRAIKQFAQKLDALIEATDEWCRSRLVSEASGLLSAIKSDVTIAVYEPKSIRPALESLYLRLDFVQAAQNLLPVLLAASNTLGGGSPETIPRMFREPPSVEQAHGFDGKEPTQTIMANLASVRMNRFQESLRKLGQVEHA